MANKCVAILLLALVSIAGTHAEEVPNVACIASDGELCARAEVGDSSEDLLDAEASHLMQDIVASINKLRPSVVESSAQVLDSENMDGMRKELDDGLSRDGTPPPGFVDWEEYYYHYGCQCLNDFETASKKFRSTWTCVPSTYSESFCEAAQGVLRCEPMCVEDIWNTYVEHCPAKLKCSSASLIAGESDQDRVSANSGEGNSTAPVDLAALKQQQKAQEDVEGALERKSNTCSSLPRLYAIGA